MEVSGALAGGMHAFTQVLLVPVIVVLAALVLFAAYNAGSAIAEKPGERRGRRPDVLALLEAVDHAEAACLRKAVQDGGLSARQCEAVLELLDHAALPADARVALARRLLEAVMTGVLARLAEEDGEVAA